MNRRTGWALALLLFPIARSLTAQAVRGQVLDALTRRPVLGGIVRLLREDGSVADSSITGLEGRFRVAAVPGTYRIQARAIGFHEVIQGPLALTGGREQSAVVLLQHLAVRLDPVEVVGRAERARAHLLREGFFERQRADFGHFVEREEIAARQARRFSDLLIVVPGVSILPAPGGLGRTRIQLRGSLLSSGGICQPRVYVDGLVINRGDSRPPGMGRDGRPEDQATERAARQFDGDEISIDDVVMPDDVEGIEIYRSATQVPVRFGGSSTETRCGAIVIWTRQGGRPR